MAIDRIPLRKRLVRLFAAAVAIGLLPMMTGTLTADQKTPPAPKSTTPGTPATQHTRAV